MKTTQFLFRINEDDLNQLREIATLQKTSVSDLVRSAAIKKYKLKGEKVRKIAYVENRKTNNGPKKGEWTQQEIVVLVKLYQPRKRGSKKNIAEKLGRSYESVKHKVRTLQLTKVAS